MSHYRYDPRDVKLDGIDIGTFIAALYNNAMTGGFGTLHHRNDLMQPAEGAHIFENLKDAWVQEWKKRHADESLQNRFMNPVPVPTHQGGLCFDSINGRSVKTWIDWDADGNYTMPFSRFWDYNYMPVQAIIDLARKGQYGRLGGQDILDAGNEAKILLKACNEEMDEDDLESASKSLAVRLLEQQEIHIEQMNGKITGNSEPAPIYGMEYQISLAGNAILHGEVGFFVPPYEPSLDAPKAGNSPAPKGP